MKGYLSKPDTMRKDIDTLLAAAGKWLDKKVDIPIQDIAARKRYVALTGLILWARDQKENETARDASSVEQHPHHPATMRLRTSWPPRSGRVYRRGLTEAEGKRLVWTVSLNRRASHALTRSVPAVKADAARTLFKVDCKDIVWAVIDSGIDANHRAFLDGRPAHYAHPAQLRFHDHPRDTEPGQSERRQAEGAGERAAQAPAHASPGAQGRR